MAGSVAALVASGVLLASPGEVHGQWTEAKGAGWTSITMYQQSTSEVYDAQGDRQPYLLNGRASAFSTFITTDVGLAPGVDAWIQLAYQRLEFEDLAEIRRSAGLGDLRLYVRWSPSSRWGWSLPVAIRGGVKVPVGDFDAFSSILPLGDGQTDFELVGEVGHSFWPADAYVTGWLGYRWRRPQSLTGFEFGNERFFLVTGGWTSERLGARLGVEGWSGSEPTQLALAGTAAARRMVRVLPSLTLTLGPGVFEVGTRVPLSGRNLPAGPDLSLGYFVKWGGGGS